MTEKISKNQDRIIETTSGNDGDIAKIDEFWSAESLRKRPISEQYPKLKNETDDQYNARLQEIQDLAELAQANLTEEDKREIENGAYTEKSGRAVTPNYKKFGVDTLRAFDMAEKNPGLFRSDKEKYGLERQQAQEDKANYYIKIYQKNQPELNEFSGLVPADKLAHDKSYLREKEEKIMNPIAWEDPEEYERDKHVKIWDQLAEAVLYPLTLNFGLFDNNIIGSGKESSGQCRARAIYPSKYDDLRHGVDTAFMIPTDVDKRGKIQYVPVILVLI